MKLNFIIFLFLAHFTASADSVKVVFRYTGQGNLVAVTGSFTNWSNSGIPMKEKDNTKFLELSLPAGYHYYKFIVDGIWISDPENPVKYSDGGDGYNSVVKAGNPPVPKRKQGAPKIPAESLPKPVLPAHPEYIELYYEALRMAQAKIAQGTSRNGFVAAYMDEGFNELIFQWDTAFMTFFTTPLNGTFPSVVSLDNFYRKQRPDGYIQRVYNESDGTPAAEPTGEEPMINPPLFAWAEYDYYKYTGDKSRIVQVYPALKKYFHWIVNNCESDIYPGLYCTTPLGSGMDNIPRPDMARAAWVDFSAQIAFTAVIMQQLAVLTGNNGDDIYFSGLRDSINKNINTFLWDTENKCYSDLARSGKYTGVRHIGSFWTLLSGAATGDRLEQILSDIDNPRYFRRKHRLPALAASDSLFSSRGHYWRGGVWAPTNFMVVKGLEANGKFEKARELALNHLTNIYRVFAASKLKPEHIPFEERYEDSYKTIWECYSPDLELPSTRWDNTFYSRQDFTGWSALGPVRMLMDYIIGITVDGVNNTIIWNIPDEDIAGLENFTLSGEKISLLAERTGSSYKISTVCKKPFMLKVVKNKVTRFIEVFPGSESFTVYVGQK